jgi:hypothetical protein
MKIKLTIELELPDDCNDWADAELQQLLFDEYVNHATCAHLEAATKWCAKAKVGSENEDPGGKQIFEMHKNWGEICGKAQWDFERMNNPLHLQGPSIEEERVKEAVGLTRQEVIDLLGQPFTTGGTSRRQKRPTIFVYGIYELSFGKDQDDPCVWVMNGLTHEMVNHVNEGHG